MVVLVDIDHTLCDSYWRDPMIGAATWDEYHAEGIKDKPIAVICELVWALAEAGNTVVGITMRPEKWRQMTMRWMLDNVMPLSEVLMRSDDDFDASSASVKLRLARQRFGEPVGKKVSLLIEDREDVCRAFAAEGVTCVQVFKSFSSPS